MKYPIGANGRCPPPEIPARIMVRLLYIHSIHRTGIRLFGNLPTPHVKEAEPFKGQLYLTLPADHFTEFILIVLDSRIDRPDRGYPSTFPQFVPIAEIELSWVVFDHRFRIIQIDLGQPDVGP